MEIIKRLFIGITFGSISNGLFWGVTWAIIAGFYVKNQNDSTWVIATFVALGLLGTIVGGITGGIIGLLNLPMLIGSLIGGVVSLNTLLLFTSKGGTGDNNLFFIVFYLLIPSLLGTLTGGLTARLTHTPQGQNKNYFLSQLR